MSSKLPTTISAHFDKDYISLFYQDEVSKIPSISTYHTQHAPQRVDEVCSKLAQSVSKVADAIIQALQKDINSATCTKELPTGHFDKSLYQSTLAKIINELFFIIIEEPEFIDPLYSQASYHRGQQQPPITTLTWDYKRQAELRLMLGQHPLHSQPADVGLNRLRIQPQYCDFCFVVEKTEFPVHKVVLAEYSDYFNTFFNSGFKDATSDQPVQFGDQDLPAKVFEAFISYIYTKTLAISDLSVDETITLAGLSKLSFDKNLQNLCSSKLLSCINEENCFTIAQFALHHQDKRLLHLCEHFLKKNSAIQEALQSEIESGTLSTDQLVSMHDIGQELNCKSLSEYTLALLLSKINAETLEELCLSVNKSVSSELKDKFKKAAYTFVTQNSERISSVEMKSARKAYKALMTGLVASLKKQKTE